MLGTGGIIPLWNALIQDTNKTGIKVIQLLLEIDEE
jgi:hypothetical protein